MSILGTVRAGACAPVTHRAPVYDNNVGVLAKTFARLVNAALPPQVASAQKIADNPSTVEAHRTFVQGGVGCWRVPPLVVVDATTKGP